MCKKLVKKLVREIITEHYKSAFTTLDIKVKTVVPPECEYKVKKLCKKVGLYVGIVSNDTWAVSDDRCKLAVHEAQR